MPEVKDPEDPIERLPVIDPDDAVIAPVIVADVAVTVPSFFTVNNPPALIRLLNALPLPMIEMFLAVTAPAGVTVKFAEESPPVVSLPAQNEYVPVADKPVYFDGVPDKVFSIFVSVIFQSAICACVVMKVGVPAEAFETI